MKYVIRRAVFATIVSPLVAGAYVLGYAVLVGLGASAGISVVEAWGNGWLLAVSVGLVFTFSPQLNTALDKIGA